MEISDKDIEEIEPEPWYKGPIKIILMLFLLLILILWIFPTYSIKLDPQPKNIPTIDEVFTENIELNNSKITINSRNDYYKLINPSDPIIKRTADKIASISCTGNRVCNAKAIFYFVRDNFDYVNDPLSYDYVKSAKESLVLKVGDCDDASVLAANLLNAVGIETRFVFVPSHVYVEAWLPEALKRYKSDQDWVALDLTCKSCEFGQVAKDYGTKSFI